MGTIQPDPGELVTTLHERFFRAIKKTIDAEMSVDHWMDLEARDFCRCFARALSAQATLRDCQREGIGPNAAAMRFMQLRGDALTKKFTDILGITTPKPAPHKRPRK